MIEDEEMYKPNFSPVNTDGMASTREHRGSQRLCASTAYLPMLNANEQECLPGLGEDRKSRDAQHSKQHACITRQTKQPRDLR